MKGWIHQSRGVVTLRITGAEPEGFLNACAGAGIRFWGSRPVDGVTVELRIHADRQRQAEEIARKQMCDLEVLGQTGLPFLLARLRRRAGFWVGMTGAVLAVSLLSQFLLSVEVRGNEQVPAAVILSELRRLGVRPGAFGPGLEEGAIAQEALIALQDLSWMAINIRGTRAEVLVREKIPRPELEQTGPPADVVAGTAGLLTRVEAWQGKALLEGGDTVAAGDVVISGWMPMPLPTDPPGTPPGGRAVRAEGRVEARTWRRLEAGIPLEGRVKEYTGEETCFYSLHLFGKRVNFYRNSSISYEEYDKITEYKWLTIPGGRTLPLALLTERVREVELLSVPLDAEAAAALLAGELERLLSRLVGEGEVVSRQVSREQTGGILTVRLLAECREEIGKTVDWPS